MLLDATARMDMRGECVKQGLAIAGRTNVKTKLHVFQILTVMSVHVRLGSRGNSAKTGLAYHCLIIALDISVKMAASVHLAHILGTTHANVAHHIRASFVRLNPMYL